MEHCTKCLGFIQDYLEFPQHPSEELHTKERPRRVRACSGQTAPILLRILAMTPISRYEELEVYDKFVNGERRIDTAKVTEQDLHWIYARCVRLYFRFRIQSKQIANEIDCILTLLQEHMILTKCYEKYRYEQWFAQKFIYLLQNMKHIHREHGGLDHPSVKKAAIRISIPTPPVNWYDLYD